jgi:hypothetical protein
VTQEVEQVLEAEPGRRLATQMNDHCRRRGASRHGDGDGPLMQVRLKEAQGIQAYLCANPKFCVRVPSNGPADEVFQRQPVCDFGDFLYLYISRSMQPMDRDLDGDGATE